MLEECTARDVNRRILHIVDGLGGRVDAAGVKYVFPHAHTIQQMNLFVKAYNGKRRPPKLFREAASYRPFMVLIR